MQCIPHSSCGQCSAYPIAPVGNAVHTPLLLWAMQCIPHSSCGQCSAYPIAPVGNAVHTPKLLCEMQCIPHSSCGQCSAYPIAPVGNAVHTPKLLWEMQCIPHSSCGQCSAHPIAPVGNAVHTRSEEHTSELQSRGLISYAVFCLKKKKENIGDAAWRVPNVRPPGLRHSGAVGTQREILVKIAQCDRECSVSLVSYFFFISEAVHQ